MRELSVVVDAARAEVALDVLALVSPWGVLQLAAPEGVKLVVRGAPDELPPVETLREASGGAAVTVREVPDAWAQRRLLDVAPLVVGGRVAVRPAWAPRVPGVAADVAIDAGSAFGHGTHPTTEMCLDALLAIPVAGALADLGCGTGVLAIAAARLGWSPVVAVDAAEDAVRAATANVAHNGVEVDVRAADLLWTDPPACDVALANVPLAVHLRLARLLQAPVVVVSGVTPVEAEVAARAYGERGWAVDDGARSGPWAVLTLARG